MGSRGGTETNRARVKRRGAAEKKGKKERECEHDNDRVSERAGVNERQAERERERDESMWNTKGETDAANLSLTVRLYLSLSPSSSFATFFFTCLFLCCSPHLKKIPSAHFLFSSAASSG